MAWSFAVSGNPTLNSYFIVSTGQAAAITAGNLFTDVLNPGQVFTVTQVGTPFAGFVNVSFAPNAVAVMNSPDVVTQFLPPPVAEAVLFP